MSQKNSHWRRYVFNMLLCLTSFHIVKPPWKALEINFNLKFGKKREIWGLYWIVRRAKYRGRCLVKSLKEQFVLYFRLHKPAQTFQSYFSATFNTFLETIDLIISTFMQSFSKKLTIFGFWFKFLGKISVWHYETQHHTCSRSTDFTGMWVRLQLWHSF